MPLILNLFKLHRMSGEAMRRGDFAAEYHYGALAIAGGLVWGLLLGSLSFVAGCYVFG